MTLVLRLPFDEATGSSARDVSGNGNHGTISGATRVSGKYGKALSFPGTGSVTITNCQGLPSTAISVACWVKFNAFANWWDIIHHKWMSAGGWNLYCDANGTISFGVCDNTPSQHNARKTGLQTGQWYFVAGTYDGTTVRIFVNGVEGTPASLSGQTLDNVGDVKCPLDLNGIIDEVRIYNRALTTTEIGSLYSKGMVTDWEVSYT